MGTKYKKREKSVQKYAVELASAIGNWWSLLGPSEESCKMCRRTNHMGQSEKHLCSHLPMLNFGPPAFPRSCFCL